MRKTLNCNNLIIVLNTSEYVDVAAKISNFLLTISIINNHVSITAKALTVDMKPQSNI